MKLEIGSGMHPTPGFAHLDANAALPLNVNPGAWCNRTDPHLDVLSEAWPLIYRSDSIEEIRAVDVLEHLSYRDTDACLAEWARVLEPGGRLYVQVPDAHRILSMWAHHEYGLLIDRTPPELLVGDEYLDAWAGLVWRLLGGHEDAAVVGAGDWRWNAHNALFTAHSLGTAIERAGLVLDTVDGNPHPNLLVWARKP